MDKTSMEDLVTYLAVKDTEPCAKCGGEMYLSRVHEEGGTLQCRSCSHHFEVVFQPAEEP